MIRLGWRRDRPWSSVADPGQQWASGWSVVLSGKPTKLESGWQREERATQRKAYADRIA